MDLYDRVKVMLQDMVSSYQEAKGDGSISATEAFQLLTRAVGHMVKVAESLGGTGAEKKATVVAAAQRFYDEILRPLDLPMIPNLLETTIVDPLLGKAVPVLVGGIIDGLVGFFNDTGWPSSPSPTPPVPDIPAPGNPVPSNPGTGGVQPPPGWQAY